MHHTHAPGNDENGRPHAAVLQTIPEMPPPAIDPDGSAAIAVQTAIATGWYRLQALEPSARRGEVEGVHRMRTTARRLRSEFHLFEDLFAADWADRMAEELKWLGHCLGEARDLDVLETNLRDAAGELAGALGPLFQSLHERHASATEALVSALQGERFATLLEELAEAAEHPALTDRAQEPCQTILPRLVKESWKSLKKGGRALVANDPDDHFHEVRKRAKETRYAAESVAPALDFQPARAATRFAKQARAVQDILGAHQDAVIAGQEIAQVVTAHPDDGPFNFAAGRLLAKEEQIARDTRAQFFSVWKKLDRKPLRRWLKGS